jgi:hypothetical protein
MHRVPRHDRGEARNRGPTRQRLPTCSAIAGTGAQSAGLLPNVQEKCPIPPASLIAA